MRDAPQLAGDGPVEAALQSGTYPSQLIARVLDPSGKIVFGYDIEGDLAVHYHFSDLLFLLLTGDLPKDSSTSSAFETLLFFVGESKPGDAPAHAANLTWLYGADTSAVLSIAAIALAEQARYLIESHKEFLMWLKTPNGTPATNFLAPNDTASETPETVLNLRTRFAQLGILVPAFEFPLKSTPAILAGLDACGISRPDQIERTVVVARFLLVLAEANSSEPLALSGYPLGLPRFVETRNP